MSEVTPPVLSRQPQNGLGTAALVLGIVQFFCFPLIGGVLASSSERWEWQRPSRGSQPTVEPRRLASFSASSAWRCGSYSSSSLCLVGCSGANALADYTTTRRPGSFDPGLRRVRCRGDIRC